MRSRLPLLLLTLCLASPALATGVDLAWDNCPGEPSAASLKTFACDVNSGHETLWIAFESAVPATNMGRIEVAIQFQTRRGNPLPVWWDFEDFASCRRAAFGVDTAPPTATTVCATISSSGDPPKFVVDRIDYQLPTVDAGRMVVVTGSTLPLVANQRYLACRFLLLHAKTSDCVGCSEPVSITVTGIHVANQIITGPITQNLALWQSSPTATRASSWGALKRLYH